MELFARLSDELPPPVGDLLAPLPEPVAVLILDAAILLLTVAAVAVTLLLHQRRTAARTTADLRNRELAEALLPTPSSQQLSIHSSVIENARELDAWTRLRIPHRRKLALIRAGIPAESASSSQVSAMTSQDLDILAALRHQAG